MTFAPNPNPIPLPPVIRTTSIESMGQLYWQHSSSGSPASALWPSANLAIAVPVFLREHFTARLMGLNNGTAVSGNADVGIYRQDFTLVVSSGSTAQAGTSAIQTFNITDTVLSPGWYYMAVALDNGVGRVAAFTGGSIAHSQALGPVQMASAFPLPSTLTPAVIGQDYLPDVGIVSITDL